jgi:hypothetical protein
MEGKLSLKRTPSHHRRIASPYAMLELKMALSTEANVICVL